MRWQEAALCANRFFDAQWWDTAANHADQRRALAICSACPVQAACDREAELEQPIGVIRAGKFWSRNKHDQHSAA